MSFRIRVAVVALVATVLAPAAASATVVLLESFEQMTANSQLVVRGVAGASNVRWNPEHTRIETWTEISVEEVLKGKVSAPVSIRQVGGVIGDIGMGVAGEASFKQGEQVLLFLEHPGDNPIIYVVRSMSYGKILLEKNALGEVRAYRDAKGLGLYDPAPGSGIKLVNSREDLGHAESFVARIKRAVKGAR